MRLTLLAALLVLVACVGCATASAVPELAEDSGDSAVDLQQRGENLDGSEIEDAAEPELKQFRDRDDDDFSGRSRRRSDFGEGEGRRRRSRLGRRFQKYRRYFRTLRRFFRRLRDGRRSLGTSGRRGRRGRGLRRLFRRLRSLARLLNGLRGETAACKLSKVTSRRLTRWADRLRPFANATAGAASGRRRALAIPPTRVATADLDGGDEQVEFS